jgi:purine-nucleoside phosphorylase
MLRVISCKLRGKKMSDLNYQRAVEAITNQTDRKPKIGLVLGSGLGTLADEIDNATVIPYEMIPDWPRSTVHGHSGNLIIGELEGLSVVAQQGRAHFYEGYSMRQVTFPIRIFRALGVEIIILTNAAGGLNQAYRTGDVMLISDHINLPGMVGNNPLMGPNDDSIGPRFPAMTHTYDQSLRKLARQVAATQGLELQEGVYVALSGPFFETPAEVRMLRIWGADAVGMSTVHEVLVARHSGMRVLAFSGITNEAVDTTESELAASHDEVLEAGKVIVPKLIRLLRGILREIVV